MEKVVAAPSGITPRDGMLPESGSMDWDSGVIAGKETPLGCKFVWRDVERRLAWIAPMEPVNPDC